MSVNVRGRVHRGQAWQWRGMAQCPRNASHLNAAQFGSNCDVVLDSQLRMPFVLRKPELTPSALKCLAVDWKANGFAGRSSSAKHHVLLHHRDGSALVLQGGFPGTTMYPDSRTYRTSQTAPPVDQFAGLPQMGHNAPLPNPVPAQPLPQQLPFFETGVPTADATFFGTDKITEQKTAAYGGFEDEPPLLEGEGSAILKALFCLSCNAVRIWHIS